MTLGLGMQLVQGLECVVCRRVHNGWPDGDTPPNTPHGACPACHVAVDAETARGRHYQRRAARYVQRYPERQGPVRCPDSGTR